jgi:hypothetical protein
MQNARVRTRALDMQTDSPQTYKTIIKSKDKTLVFVWNPEQVALVYKEKPNERLDLYLVSDTAKGRQALLKLVNEGLRQGITVKCYPKA